LENAIKEKFTKANITVPDVKAFIYPNAEPIVSTVTGKVLWELDFNDHSIEPVHGKSVNENDVVCTIQTKHGMEQILSFCEGRIVRVEKKQGELVSKGETICFIEGIRMMGNS
jgi:pyruvate carboxylase subunit B